MRPFAAIVLAGALLLTACERRTAAPAENAIAAATPLDGGALYVQHCASCHMADGSGVPNLQPSLRDSAIVAGDEKLLIQVLLRGPAVALPANRERYGNTMADFSLLTDAEIAAVLNYTRHTVKGRDATITEAMVASERAGP